MSTLAAQGLEAFRDMRDATLAQSLMQNGLQSSLNVRGDLPRCDSLFLQKSPVWTSKDYLVLRRSRPLLIGLSGLSSTGRKGLRLAALLDGRLRGCGF